MELVAGAMRSLLPKLGELLKEEYGLQKGVRKKIEILSRELEAAQAVLRKIGDVPPDQLEELVRLWARDIREASYDMEDIIDTFLVRVDDDPAEHADANKLRHLLEKVGTLFKKSKARRKVSRLIDDMNEKLEAIAARRGRYTADSIVAKSVTGTTIDPRILNLYKRATDLVGIEGPVDELINKLSLEGDVGVPDQKTKVVSVYGFPGLGKTTLAKAVYDKLKPYFERGAFVPVGQNPDMKKVFRDILIDLDCTTSNVMVLDERQLMNVLGEFVKEKKCFIVIDDIWDKKPWKLIECALRDSKCGSRVVVTTRSHEVATYAGEAYKIQPLSRDNSEKLLYARIVDGEGKYFDSPPTDTLDKILDKCGGVPLAIITVSSLLASKPGEYWSEIYKSIGFGHGGNDVVENTRKILSFSYYDLPSHLKPCLLYLSIFPEDEEIKKSDLIWMWVAEGFIHKEEGASVGLFELGERYFNELINRSMIQPIEKNYCYVYACRVHDMVFDMVRSLSSQEDFVTVLDGDKLQKFPGSIARRLALQTSDRLANIPVDKVRSLIARCSDFGSSCPQFPALRVLHMGERYGDILDHLGRFLHLRYLQLTFHGITELPREVRYLKFLQTLDIYKCFGAELPEEVGLLTQLICLRAPRSVLGVPDGLIGKLTSLQHLCIMCAARNRMQFVKELGMLREMRELHIWIRVKDESMERALLESLGNLHNIRELEIIGYSCRYLHNSEMRHAGFVSCRYLQYLRLECVVFSGLPAWIKPSLAPNLSFLGVKLEVVKEHDMETLSRLPELRSLELHSRDVVSLKISSAQGAGYFRKLRALKITGSTFWLDLRGCESNTSVAPAIMPSLEVFKFSVQVRILKDAGQLSFDRLLLVFEDFIGRTPLQRVTALVNCSGALTSEVEEVEAALERTAAIHPKRLTLETERLAEYNMLSPYQEACMDVSRTPDFVIKTWKLEDIVDSGHIRSLRIPPDPAASSSSKVVRLVYNKYGTILLTLSSNAVLKRWEWSPSAKNPHGKPTTSVLPQLSQPKNDPVMTNDTSNGSPEAAAGCIALSQDDPYIISASGGKISRFHLWSGERETLLIAPPPAATFLAFYPYERGVNLFVIGMEDSSIQIYDARTDEVEKVLMGHQKKITGLTFSRLMSVVVSSGADAKLCVWSIEDDWEKKNTTYLRPPSNHSGDLAGDTMVQFHYDQTHLLVIHESQLSIYDGTLECLHSWFPRDALSSPISSAVYSSDGLLVYAGFRDGAIRIFEAQSLRLQCRVAPSAYIPSSVSSCGEDVYPMDVAANPWKPNQIAVGMSDGAVHLLEPMEED